MRRPKADQRRAWIGIRCTLMTEDERAVEVGPGRTRSRMVSVRPCPSNADTRKGGAKGHVALAHSVEIDESSSNAFPEDATGGARLVEPTWPVNYGNRYQPSFFQGRRYLVRKDEMLFFVCVREIFFFGRLNIIVLT